MHTAQCATGFKLKVTAILAVRVSDGHRYIYVDEKVRGSAAPKGPKTFAQAHGESFGPRVKTKVFVLVYYLGRKTGVRNLRLEFVH